MVPLMVPMMSHLIFNGLKTHLNYMIKMYWVILMDMKMAYLRAQPWSMEARRLDLKKAWYLALMKCLDLHLDL